MPVESNSILSLMWSTQRNVAPGDLVIVWLVRHSLLILATFSHPSTDTRPRPIPRRHSWHCVQQQIRRLSPLGPRRHPLRFKGRLPHRQGLRPHPPTHPRIMDPRITSQNSDSLSRRHCVYHLVAIHPTWKRCS